MSKKLNILIVEDEIVASTYLSMILNEIEFIDIGNIYEAMNACEALEIVKCNKIDLLFMDINIDGSMDGITCAEYIHNFDEIPIIFTTAQDDTKTILRANKTNISGYIIKPFQANTVEATLAVALKNLKDIQKNEMKKIVVGEIEYDLKTKTFSKNGESINFTKKETAILAIFFTNKNTNLSYEIFKDTIWEDDTISNSTIRDKISKIKKKTPILNIENISGIGYVLKA